MRSSSRDTADAFLEIGWQIATRIPQSRLEEFAPISTDLVSPEVRKEFVQNVLVVRVSKKWEERNNLCCFLSNVSFSSSLAEIQATLFSQCGKAIVSHLSRRIRQKG